MMIIVAFAVVCIQRITSLCIPSSIPTSYYRSQSLVQHLLLYLIKSKFMICLNSLSCILNVISRKSQNI